MVHKIEEGALVSNKHEYFEAVYIKDWWAVLPVDLLIALEYVYYNKGASRNELAFSLNDLIINVQLSKFDREKYSFLSSVGVNLPKNGLDALGILESLGLICDTDGRIGINNIRSVCESFPTLPDMIQSQIDNHHELLKHGVKMKMKMKRILNVTNQFSGESKGKVEDNIFVSETEQQDFESFFKECISNDPVAWGAQDWDGMMKFLETYESYLIEYLHPKGGMS